ncbi:MAG: TfuA-like protein [Pseudomonadota bacterium]
MTVFVFIGPTISEADARQELEAIYMPPAQMGDVYRVALEGPSAIGIIDGYFERAPSVWHKEVLWALRRGVRVFGAASMGALRAAELQVFGMDGVGDIFHAFQSGDLHDDDEVAIAHADASSGYRASSEAMVNIRATLKLAEGEQVISSELRVRLEAWAKQTFYAERNYPDLLAKAAQCSSDLDQLEALKAFIGARRVDAKRDDALALLRRIREWQASGAPAPECSFELANSEPWTQLRAWARNQPRLAPKTEEVQASLIAAEARCHGRRGRLVIAGAFARALSAVPDARDQLDELVLAEARDAGVYDELARRAVDKQNTLERHGFAHPTFEDAGLPASYVLEWYLSLLDVEHHSEAAVPERILRALGAPPGALLEAEALREYLYQRLVPQAANEL